jgi:hypothetical protein
MYHCLRSRFGRTRWNSKVTWVMWNLVLVYLEIVLVSVEDRCTVCAKHTIGLEIVLDTPDSAPMWRSSSGCLIQFIWYNANLDATRCKDCAEHTTSSENHFGCTWWYSLGTRLKWKLDLDRSKLLLILTQDRCTVCVERTIASEVILVTPDGSLRWRGSCGISFWSI